MPDVRMPDGAVVRFPDDMPADQIKGIIASKFPDVAGPQAAQPRVGVSAGAPRMPEAASGYGEDMLRSGMAGVRQGVEGMAGMLGDASQMQGDIAGWAAGKMGASPEMQSRVGSVAGFLHPGGTMASTNDIRGVTNAGIGEGYEPQTTAGEYSRTLGEFAPAALAGPGSLGRKAVIGSVSALGSETAGQLTKGTAAEPYARAGGALIGGLVGGRLNVPGRGPKLPTASDIKASAGYADLKPTMQAARVDRGVYRGIVRDLKGVADDFGMVPEQHASFERILQRHGDLSAKTGASMQDLEIMRRSLANAGKSTTDASARELSRRMIDTLDKAVDAIPGGEQVFNGQTIDQTKRALSQARDTWRTGVKSEMMEMATEKARNTASGFENGLRVEFRKILNNKTLSRMFTETERQAMQKVVRGTFTGNMMRWLGGFGVPLDNGRNFLGSMIGGGAGAAMGAAVGGPAGAALGGPLLMGIGTAAKAGANASTRNSAQFAEALVKGGKQANQLVAEAAMQMRAARNLGLLRSGVHAEQAFTASRAK